MWGGVIRQFKAVPRFISSQFLRGTTGSCTFINLAVWESIADYWGAFMNPDFQKCIGQYPDITVAMPHLFRKVAIANVCIA